jgi:hypothetical protein
MLSEACDDKGPNATTHREAIGRHLIEIASKWKVVVRGHGEDAIEVASAGDSIAAAEVLFKYDMGRPPMGSAEWQLALAEHIRKVARDQAELALGLLGNRIHTMTDEEKAAFFQRCSVDARGFLAAAEAELASRDGRAQPAIEAQTSQDSVGPVAETETAASPPAAQADDQRSPANEAPPEAGDLDREKRKVHKP